MSASRVGRASQKSRSSQKASSMGTAPTQKMRESALITVTAGGVGGWVGGYAYGGCEGYPSGAVASRPEMPTPD
jgi:hypothetical protein